MCCRSDDECRSVRPIQLHNAYDLESVTVYYHWHPLCGLSLPVRSRRKDRGDERIYCELDGKIYPLPNWMLSPECSQFSVGPPVISAEALVELRELLTSLPLQADCAKASPHSSPKEGVDETIGETSLCTDESLALQYADNRNARRPKGPDPRSCGTTHQGSGRKKRAARKRRKG